MGNRISVKEVEKGEKVILHVSERPRFGTIESKILKLNKVPIVRNLRVVKKILCKIYGIPLSSHFSNEFSLLRPILRVGENTGLNDTLITGCGLIRIGANCSFSHRNMIVSSVHNIDDFDKITLKPVTIGNNVWVTSNITILGGVTIGDNTIIGAGSVVTKDIPSGVFAAGNPCKVIREIDFVK
ncbi:acyltransferase [Maribacter luteus]|uniref:Acetyltransferase n=1 Tax=Maribacter luteus TaxID=2594478 RepID=A0A6I2ML43_9FLAO|nr:acyltransferase [Maribacter luteus]MRX63339.1 acyltransferase [Maribacter luteus]